MVVSGACGNITEEDIKSVEHILSEAEIILMQLEINTDATQRVVKLAHKHGVKVVLNPAPAMPISKDILSKVFIATPNEHEAEALTGVKVTDEASADKAAQKLMEMGVENVVITLGKEGAYIKTKMECISINGLTVDAVDTTGAGDSFNGAFVTALAEDKDIFDAAKFANAAAALSVTKYGTAPAMPFRDEIDKVL